MKVCLIVPHFLPHIGGGEQLYYDIAKGLLKEGFEVRVVTSNSGGVTGHKAFEDIDTYYCDWKILFGHPVVKKKDLEEHIRWADLVHTTMFTTATKSRRGAAKYHKPCVITVHEVIGDKWEWFVSSKLKAFAFRTYEKFICRQRYASIHVDSDATKRDFIRFIGERDNLTRIYLGAHMPPPEDYRNLPVSFRDYFELLPGEIGFLYYGRPAVNKGIFVLEEAVNRLNRAGKIPNNIKFCWILSERPEEERARLLELIKSHGLERVIKIKPSTERMKLFKIISGADYVVVPSVTEGFGFCAVEACSLERPVIHSDGGSLPEVVFGRTLSFKNRDPLDLASKLEKVIKKKEEAFDRIPAKQFDTDKMVQAMIRMYHEVMNGS